MVVGNQYVNHWQRKSNRVHQNIPQLRSGNRLSPLPTPNCIAAVGIREV
jgi:hypothetical protein